MGSFFDNLKNRFNKVKDNPVLSAHTDSAETEKLSDVIPSLSSTNISDLEALNESAVNYYSQIISNGGFDTNSESYKAFKELLAVISATEIRNKLFNKNKSGLSANLKYYIDNAVEKAEGHDKGQVLINRKMNLCKAIRKLNAKIKVNPIARGYTLQVYNNQLGKAESDFCSPTKIEDSASGSELFKEYSSADNVLENKTVKFKINDHKGKIVEVGNVQSGGSDKYYAEALEKLSIAKESKDDDLIKTVIDDIENHPIYSPKFEDLEMSDRLMMALLTFIIRSITLFLINWGVDSSFITSFKQGLFYYIILYTFIFLLVVCVVNNSFTDNISIKLMFYYLNIEAQGYLRIVAHLIILYSLLPLVIILKNNNSNTNNFVVLSYQDKIKTKNAIGMFTLSSWVLTSIVALRF